jgi:hypothetical protein
VNDQTQSLLRAAFHPKEPVHRFSAEPIDKLVFQQLFQSVTEKKSQSVHGVGTDSADADVGISTVACQQDGASDRQTTDEKPAQGVGLDMNAESENPAKDDDKNNKNNVLLESMTAFSPQQDRRIFTNFEAAGLPRREIIRLAHDLHKSVVAGRESVSLGLRVPTLGEMRFDVRIAGKVVFIHAFVENEGAAAALALAVSTLKQKLEEQKLVLGRLDVTTRGPHSPIERKRAEKNSASRKQGHGPKRGYLPSLECLEAEDGASQQLEPQCDHEKQSMEIG